MNSYLPDHEGEDSVLRPYGTETRIIDSEVLLQRTFKEDARAGCAMLFRLYYAPLFSHAIRFVFSKQVAEDIVAEVFCRFWEEGTFNTITTSYRAYLFKSVRHRAYNYVKFELTRKSRHDAAECMQPALNPDEILQFDELYHVLDDAIDNLPKQCRKVFLLSRMENMRYHEIAIKLGVSVKAVEGHISRALRVLRKRLQQDRDWL